MTFQCHRHITLKYKRVNTETKYKEKHQKGGKAAKRLKGSKTLEDNEQEGRAKTVAELEQPSKSDCPATDTTYDIKCWI